LLVGVGFIIANRHIYIELCFNDRENRTTICLHAKTGIGLQFCLELAAVN